MAQTQMNPAPEKLIEPEGLIPFGNYSGAIEEMNVEDFDYRVLKRPPFSLLGPSAKLFLKRWQFVGAIDENLVVGAAVANVRYLGTGFAYVYERERDEITEKSLKSPFARGVKFSRSPSKGISEIRLNSGHILSENTLSGDERWMHFEFGEAIRGDIAYEDPGIGVSTLCPQAHEGFHYTYKSAGLRAKGRVIVGDREYKLTDNALALFDWTASTPPRQTTWNWAAGVGTDKKGNPMGINFSRGLVGGDYSQNTVWLNGKPHITEGVNFVYDPREITGHPWQIRTKDASLDLEFQPLNERNEDINLGLVVSNFHQPFGTFEGTFRVNKKTYDLKCFGFCEEHYAKW